LTLDQSEDAKSTADYLQTALAAEVDLDRTAAAVYQEPGDKNVLFFGGTTLLWTPEDDLDTAFDLISDNQGSGVGIREVAAGELPVCGWADHGSLALAMFPNRTVDEAAPLFQQIRAAVESR